MLTSLTTQNREDPVSGYWLMWLACLRLWLRLGLRSWLVFLLSRRLRFLRRCGFGFFLLLSWFCFGLLFCGRFRCLSCWGSRLLLFALLLCDSLSLRKHPVLQVRWNNTGGLLIRVDFDHACGAGSSGPCRNTLHKHALDWCLEMFRRQLPHRQPIRRSRPFVVNNELCFAASQQVVRMLRDY